MISTSSLTRLTSNTVTIMMVNRLTFMPWISIRRQKIHSSLSSSSTARFHTRAQ